MRSLLLIPLFALMLVTGCASGKHNAHQQRLARLEPGILYKRGSQAMRASDYQEAIAAYEALIGRYSLSPEAKQAHVDIIYCYFRQGEKESAKDAAETFIHDNPAHPRLDYIYYLKGLIDMERAPYAVERWMKVDLSGRVPKTAADAFESMKVVVTRFPQSPYAADARSRMIFLRNRLANYQMQVASHYMERGAWVAAAQRANQTIEQYDGAPVVIDALRMMIRCYKELGYAELAQNAEKVFHENFPGESLQTATESGHSWWKLWDRGKNSSGTKG